jgi:hypothetical protein
MLFVSVAQQLGSGNSSARAARSQAKWGEKRRPWSAKLTMPRDGLQRDCRAKSSGKVPNTHPVGAICNHNLGVFAVTKVAMEDADAVPPAHPVPRMPQAANPGLQRCGGPSVSLTFLARLPARQSLCTRHVIPLWKPVTLALPTGGARATVKISSDRESRRLSTDSEAESQTRSVAETVPSNGTCCSRVCSVTKNQQRPSGPFGVGKRGR